jgi:hypothetical protein
MAGERRQAVFDRPLPAEENQKEHNNDAEGAKSQQEDFQEAVFLPPDCSPVQILVSFGVWFSTTGPVSGESRHVLSSFPKITESGNPVLTMSFLRRLFRVSINSMKCP